jgi:hypothetical protein
MNTKDKKAIESEQLISEDATTATVEHLRADEDEARATRRAAINAGRSVSLLSYDGSRDAFVWDEYVTLANPRQMA